MATQTPQSQTSPIVSCLNGHAVTTSIKALASSHKVWRCGEVIDWLKNRPRYGN